MDWKFLRTVWFVGRSFREELGDVRYSYTADRGGITFRRGKKDIARSGMEQIIKHFFLGGGGGWGYAFKGARHSKSVKSKGTIV